MSLIKCKQIYSPTEGESEEISSKKLPLRELRKLEGITICEGFVTEAEKTLNPHRKSTEFVCVHCGHRFYFETGMYIKILNALGVDYKRRLP